MMVKDVRQEYVTEKHWQMILNDLGIAWRPDFTISDLQKQAVHLSRSNFIRAVIDQAKDDHLIRK